LALRELIADTDLTLETMPNLPQNRTAHCRENLRTALALRFAYNNFCRIHWSLRVTPAMEAGIADHVGTIGAFLA
jgi:hypothetical protein